MLKSTGSNPSGGFRNAAGTRISPPPRTCKVVGTVHTHGKQWGRGCLSAPAVMLLQTVLSDGVGELA